MGFRTVLENSQTELTASEHRIAGILLADPQNCLLLSAAQLADRANVHESTVIRFAQKLGYAGYPGLHADVAADVRQAGAMATRRLMQAAQAYELTSVVEQQLRVLADLPLHVSQESLDKAAHTLLAADRIYIYGQDIARYLVEFMERKLRRIGFDTVSLRYGGNDLAEHLVTLGEKDVLLAFALGEQRRAISWLLRRVQALGAPSILVSDHSGVTLRPSPTHLLAVPRGTGPQKPHVAPLLICYALEYALVHFAPDRVAAALERVADTARASGSLDLNHVDEEMADHALMLGDAMRGNGANGEVEEEGSGG